MLIFPSPSYTECSSVCILAYLPYHLNLAQAIIFQHSSNILSQLAMLYNYQIGRKCTEIRFLRPLSFTLTYAFQEISETKMFLAFSLLQSPRFLWNHVVDIWKMRIPLKTHIRLPGAIAQLIHEVVRDPQLVSNCFISNASPWVLFYRVH